MNNRNRHLQYRKSIYRKRRIRTIVILCVSAAVILFTLFIVIGSVLHKKTKKPSSYDLDDFYSEEETTLLSPAPTVGAYALPLLEDGSLFQDRLAAINENANAVCIALNRPDGTMLYHSSLVTTVSSIATAADASSLSSSLSSIGEDDLYVTAILYIPSFANENDLVEDIELSFWGAVICEALREGVGDVLIIAPDFEASDVEKLCAIADRVHRAVESSVVGFTLTDSVLLDENRVLLIDTLNSSFNYLALNTTQPQGDIEQAEYIEKSISDMQLDLMYYKMRVLLPRSTEASVQHEYIKTAEKYNISSWQILP